MLQILFVVNTQRYRRSILIHSILNVALLTLYIIFCCQSGCYLRLARHPGQQLITNRFLFSVGEVLFGLLSNRLNPLLSHFFIDNLRDILLVKTCLGLLRNPQVHVILQITGLFLVFGIDQVVDLDAGVLGDLAGWIQVCLEVQLVL